MTVVQVKELGDSSVNSVCCPGLRASDYWIVYWDIAGAVKEEFDRNGISTPFRNETYTSIRKQRLPLAVTRCSTVGRTPDGLQTRFSH